MLPYLLLPEFDKFSNAACDHMLQFAAQFQNYWYSNSRHDLLRYDLLGSIYWPLCLPVELQPLTYLLHLTLQGVGSCCSFHEHHLVDGQQQVVTASSPLANVSIWN
jgi:hypothetical protein